MGDPKLREEDNADEDEYFSPEAFKPRAAVDDEFNAPEAFSAPAKAQPANDAPFDDSHVQPKPSILERFLGGGREALSDAGDAINPYGDALHRFLDPNGHMDMGADFSDARVADDRAAAAAAAARSPVSSGIARAVATAPIAAVAGPATAGAAIAGADAAVDGQDWRHQLLHSFLGGIVGGAMHGAGMGIDAVEKAAEGIGERAARARVAATGLYGAAMKKLAAEIGDEGVTKLGNDIEAKGLHDAPGMAGWFPGSAERYLDNANTLADDALVRQRTAAFDATQRGVAVPTGRIANELEGQADYHHNQFDPAGESAGNFAQNLAGRIRGKSAATAQFDPKTGQPVASDYQLPFDQALDRRQYLDENIKWAQRNPTTQMPREEELRRYAANQMRGELTGALDDQAPELAGDFRNAQSDLNTALTVQTPAAARVYQEAGNQPVSLPTWIGASGGMASGNPVTGLAMGALASQVKSRGHSAQAGMLRGAQRVGETMQDPQVQALSQFLQSPGAGAVAGGIGAGAPPREVQRDAAADGNGSRLPGVINQILQDPQRAQQLGKYRAEFEQAGRSPGGINALLLKLENDREWRTNLKPQLMQLTAE